MKGVPYGFEYDDLRQERAIGRLMAERCQPGNEDQARCRAKVREARFKKKERAWRIQRVPLLDQHVAYDKLFDQILVREILDMLPVAMQDDALKALLSNDMKQISRVARRIKEECPGLDRE